MGHLNNAKRQGGKSIEGCTPRLHTSRSHNGKSFTTKGTIHAQLISWMHAHKDRIKHSTSVSTHEGGFLWPFYNEKSSKIKEQSISFVCVLLHFQRHERNLNHLPDVSDFLCIFSPFRIKTTPVKVEIFELACCLAAL